MLTGGGSRRPPMAQRRILLLTALTVALLVAPTTSPAVSATPPLDCAPPVPLEEVTPGLRGTGYTVAQGSDPQPFGVEVVGLLDNAVAPGIPLILVKASGLGIDELGIWLGMSGSPVYDQTGRLLGAVAYGLTGTATNIAGLTPAATLLDLLDAPAAADAAAGVPLPLALRERVARATGVPAQQLAAGVRRLPVPLTVPGLSSPRRDQFATAFDRSPLARATVLSATPPTSTTAAAGDLQAGGNLAAALSYGDAQMFASGTLTQRCGDVAVALGHPLLFEGEVQLGANVGDALLVHGDDPFAGLKVMNLGARVGVIDQDRLAGLRLRLGDEPQTTRITSSIVNHADAGASRDGETLNLYAPLLPTIVEAHLYANYDLLVFDDAFASGMATTSWTVRGTGEHTGAWSYRYDNRVADAADLATAATQRLVMQLAQLQANTFEEVQVTDVEYEAVVGDPFGQYEITGVDVAIGSGPFSREPVVEVAAGSDLNVRVTLASYRAAEPRIVEVPLALPDAFAGGRLEIRGADATAADPFACLADPQLCASTPVTSLRELLDGFRNAPRDDELVVGLIDAAAPDGAPAADRVRVVTPLDRPVRGLVGIDLVPVAPQG